MGSVIGLADGTGQSAGRFLYDGFGNFRPGSTATTGEAEGDFRFQGQWLESESGLYHFRARDYDAKTGLFLSRDPVDIITTAPESFNPYQFAYNNPSVYSDPSGEISISELTSARHVEQVLQGIRAEISQRARQFLIDKAKGIAGDVTKSVLKNLLPTSQVFDAIPAIEAGSSASRFLAAGTRFEQIIVDNVCDIISGSHPTFLQHLWIQPRVSVLGNPVDDGFACGSDIPNAQWFVANNLWNPRPDIIIKDGGPRTTDKNPKAYLIGDIKLSGNAIVDTIDENQWKAIMSYAKYGNRHQYTPVAFYLTFWGATPQEQKKVESAAFSKGVSVAILSILPGARR